VSESYIHLFVVPKNYKIEEDRFKQVFENQYFKQTCSHEIFEEVCKVIENLAGGGRYIHCQDVFDDIDASGDVWESMIDILKEDLVLVHEFVDGANGANDSIESLSKEKFQEIVLAMTEVNNIMDLLDKV